MKSHGCRDFSEANRHGYRSIRLCPLSCCFVFLLRSRLLQLLFLNLNSPDYTIFNWIAVLMEHRLFSIRTPVARRARQYLIDNFSVNVNAFDLIIGCRADDSYFDYAELFLNNSISVEQLAHAMQLGKLGEQIVIKSKFAFSNLKYEGFDVAEKDRYYVLRKARDDEANQHYLEMLEEKSDGLYIQDIGNRETQNAISVDNS